MHKKLYTTKDLGKIAALCALRGGRAKVNQYHWYVQVLAAMAKCNADAVRMSKGLDGEFDSPLPVSATQIVFAAADCALDVREALMLACELANSCEAEGPECGTVDLLAYDSLLMRKWISLLSTILPGKANACDS